MTTKQTVILVAVKVGLALAIGLVFILNYDNCIGNTEKKQASELKRIASTFTPYPGATAAGEKVVFKHRLVSFYLHYDTQDDFARVSEFYDNQLTTRGWRRVETPPSVVGGKPGGREYRQGDYGIFVLRDESRATHFDVVFEWSPE